MSVRIVFSYRVVNSPAYAHASEFGKWTKHNSWENQSEDGAGSCGVRWLMRAAADCCIYCMVRNKGLQPSPIYPPESETAAFLGERPWSPPLLLPLSPFPLPSVVLSCSEPPPGRFAAAPPSRPLELTPP